METNDKIRRITRVETVALWRDFTSTTHMQQPKKKEVVREEQNEIDVKFQPMLDDAIAALNRKRNTRN